MHTLPAVARLKAAWPGCRFSWVANPEWVPLLRGNPDVEEVIPFPRRDFRGVGGWLKFIRWCRKVIVGRKPDVALDFQGLLRSALIGRASGAGVFYGMADAREGARWLYDRVIPVPTGVPHAVDRYLMLADTVLRFAGVKNPFSSRATLRFPLPEGEIPGELAGRRIEDDFILLHPFARGIGKSLTAAQIEAFCRRLAPRQVILVGKWGDGPFAVPKTALDLLDHTSLSELIWLVRRASSVISVDSGPAHLAAALGRQLVAVHTWSDPRRVGPYRQQAWVWKSGKLLQMSQLAFQDEGLFRQPPTPLTTADIDAICARATSPSDFYA